MTPTPPLPPQMPLEPHFKGEWWARLTGLSGLSFNHKWDPSLFFLPLSLYLPPLLFPTALSLSLCGWGKVLSQRSPLSQHPPPLHPFLFCLYAFPAHRWSGASVPPGWLAPSPSLRNCRVLLCPREQGRWGEGGRVVGGREVKRGSCQWQGALKWLLKNLALQWRILWRLALWNSPKTLSSSNGTALYLFLSITSAVCAIFHKIIHSHSFFFSY